MLPAIPAMIGSIISIRLMLRNARSSDLMTCMTGKGLHLCIRRYHETWQDSLV